MQLTHMNQQFVEINTDNVKLDFFRNKPQRVGGTIKCPVDLTLPEKLRSFEQKCDTSSTRFGMHMADRLRMERDLLLRAQPMGLSTEHSFGMETLIENREDLIDMRDLRHPEEAAIDHRGRLEAAFRVA